MMYLKKLLSQRDNWKIETVENIKKSLCLYDDETSMSKVELDKSEKLVVIYGLPQIGKTTLILNLLGIKKEFFSSVYDILRADVEYGTSSTSTAIIYRRSKNEQFGFAFKQNLTENIEMTYLSDDDFKNELKQIRNKVESKQLQTSILYIAIPKHYYLETTKNYSNIDILDMPGVSSKNDKEKTHVDSLFKTYLAFSSLCIIACTAEQIQGLETVKLPNDDGDKWHEFPSRYVVVTTKSYSKETIKKELLKGKKDYFDYIHQIFKNELLKVFPQSKELEIYPLDVGDSFESLCNEIPGIREKLEETREKFFEEIRKTVQTRRGNDLKNIIDNLIESINVSAKTIKTDIEKNGKEKQEEIKELTNYSAGLKDKIESINKQNEKYKEEIKKLNSTGKVSFDLAKICKGCDDILSYEEKTKEDFKNRTIKKRFYSWIEDLYKEAKEQAREIDINFVRFPEEIENILSKDIFPTSYVYEQKVLHYKHSPANKRNNKLEKCMASVLSELMVYGLKLETFLEEKLSAKNNRQRDETERKSQIYTKLKKNWEQEKEKIESEIYSLGEQVIKNEAEIEDLDEKLKHDRNLLENYRKIASKVFKEHKAKILEKINNPSLSVEKRLAYIFFLGICKSDYNKIIGVIDNE